MASILGKPGGPGQFPTHDLSTVRGALHFVDNKFLVFRVPYPIGYFTKWMDGRVDDVGWKGKSLWSTYATRTMFHLETGKGTGKINRPGFHRPRRSRTRRTCIGTHWPPFGAAMPRALRSVAMALLDVRSALMQPSMCGRNA